MGELEKTVTLTTGKKVTVRSLPYEDIMDIHFIASRVGSSESFEWKRTYERHLMMKACSLSEEELKQLSLTDGTLLNTFANKLNLLDTNFLLQYGLFPKTLSQTVKRKQSDSTKNTGTPEASPGKK